MNIPTLHTDAIFLSVLLPVSDLIHRRDSENSNDFVAAYHSLYIMGSSQDNEAGNVDSQRSETMYKTLKIKKKCANNDILTVRLFLNVARTPPNTTDHKLGNQQIRKKGKKTTKLYKNSSYTKVQMGCTKTRVLLTGSTATLWNIYPINETEFYVAYSLYFPLSEELYLSRDPESSNVFLTALKAEASVFSFQHGRFGPTLSTLSSDGITHYGFGLRPSKILEIENARSVPSSSYSGELSLENIEAHVNSVICFVPTESCLVTFVSHKTNFERFSALHPKDSQHYTDDSGNPFFYFGKPLLLEAQKLEFETSKLLKRSLSLKRKKIENNGKAEQWKARDQIRVGTVLATEQNKFYSLFFPEIRYEGDCDDRSNELPHTSTDSSANALETSVRLGHPYRSFALKFIFTIRDIKKDELIVVVQAPDLGFDSDVTIPDMVECTEWPRGEPYYHGIGKHTCGAPILSPPLNRLRIVPCSAIGDSQKGLMATEYIPYGVVFPYGGEISDKVSPYSWATSDGTHIVGGNIMRYANTYHGLSQSPNAVLLDISVYHPDGSFSAVPCVALISPVSPGEMILVHSYGRDADFEVMRKMLCDNEYLPLSQFPSQMLLPGMEAMDNWYLPGDVIAVISQKNSPKSNTRVQIYTIHQIYQDRTVSAFRLQVKPGSLVDFFLRRGSKPVSLSLDEAILLIPDEDYEVTQKQHSFYSNTCRDITPPPASRSVDNQKNRSIRKMTSPWKTVSPGSKLQCRGPIDELLMENCAHTEYITDTLSKGEKNRNFCCPSQPYGCNTYSLSRENVRCKA